MGGINESASRVGPVQCTDISKENLVRELVNAEGCSAVLFFNLNAHALNLILKTPALAEVWNGSDLTFCDGFGVILLNHLFGRGKLHHRMTPPDFVDEVYAGLHDRRGKIFFLGDEKTNVQSYAHGVETRFPGLVAGWHDGFFEFGSPAEDALIEEINFKKPDLLLIGMGMPRQELWVVRNKERLRCKRALSVGALFSWGITNRRRGPRWATDHGFEWLFRLFLEPKRVWRRYLIGLPEVSIRLMAFQLRYWRKLNRY